MDSIILTIQIYFYYTTFLTIEHMSKIFAFLKHVNPFLSLCLCFMREGCLPDSIGKQASKQERPQRYFSNAEEH